MADTFTDMHRQLDGKIDRLAEEEVGARKCVKRHAKGLDDELLLLDVLGLEIVGGPA